MSADLYVRTLLTVIAGALLVIAWNGVTYRPVDVYALDCGRNIGNPCYVSIVQHGHETIAVEIRDGAVRIDDNVPLRVRPER